MNEEWKEIMDEAQELLNKSQKLYHKTQKIGQRMGYQNIGQMRGNQGGSQSYQGGQSVGQMQGWQNPMMNQMPVSPFQEYFFDQRYM